MEITFYRKLAYKLADTVVDNQEYSDADAKRIRYGLVCIFSDLYKFILLLIVFSLFLLTKEFLIAFIGILLLRPFVAGYHAKTELVCILMSFTTMLISVVVGQMNILSPYLQVFLIILLPIIGLIISPVRIKIVENKNIGLKLMVGIMTTVILLVDYYVLTSQILFVSVIQIYLLALYQMLKIYIISQNLVKI